MKRITKSRKEVFSTHVATILPFALAAILVAGCAAKSNPALDEARMAYKRASADEFVAQNAPVSLQEAELALQTAEKSFTKGGGKDVDSLAYVALRRVQIAEELAAKNAAQQKLEGLGERRSNVLLEARDAELAALRAKKTDRGIMITLGDVLFEFGKADLKPGSVRGLDPLVSFLREYPERNLLIEGHTDSIGSDASNMVLSQRRADSVTDALAVAGVDRARITARGLSQPYPVASNNTPAGRQQNRRVELIILPDGQTGPQAAARGPWAIVLAHGVLRNSAAPGGVLQHTGVCRDFLRSIQSECLSKMDRVSQETDIAEDFLAADGIGTVDIQNRVAVSPRGSGVLGGGPPPLTNADRKSFADQLDRILSRYSRSGN
jgi:OOP family OmpA-OmpF porin